MLSRVLLITWLSSYIVLNARGSFIFDLFRSQNSDSNPKSTQTSTSTQPSAKVHYEYNEKDSSIGRSGQGWGWGWPQHGWGHGGHDQNMDLYSLLGGLSFASLLGATIIYLARRNTSGRRRRRDVLSGSTYFDDDDEEMKGGMSMADVLSSISNYVDSPWWGKYNSTNTNNKYEFKIH